MSGEYLLTVNVPAGETRVFPIPSAGICGVYSTAAVTLKWDFNGGIGQILTGPIWEPHGGFHPADTSALIIDNTNGVVAVDVAIRAIRE